MGSAQLPFANDGSFFEKFSQLQQEKPKDHPPLSAAESSGLAEQNPVALALDEEAGSTLPSCEHTPQAGAADSPSATFIPSSSFSGGRQGYVFKIDAQGLGYYLDAPPHLRPKQQLDKSKPVLLKTNNPISKLQARKPMLPADRKRKLGKRTVFWQCMRVSDSEHWFLAYCVQFWRCVEHDTCL